MEFFGMGMGEILLIVIVVLIIWGPGKMPEIARQIGKAINTIKQTSSDLTTQITKELDEEEAKGRSHSPEPQVTASAKAAKSLPAPAKGPDAGTGED